MIVFDTPGELEKPAPRAINKLQRGGPTPGTVVPSSTLTPKETRVSRYPFPDLNTLPEDIRARILEVQEKAGFIPNVFLAFARRPAGGARAQLVPFGPSSSVRSRSASSARR